MASRRARAGPAACSARRAPSSSGCPGRPPPTQRVRPLAPSGRAAPCPVPCSSPSRWGSFSCWCSSAWRARCSSFPWWSSGRCCSYSCRGSRRCGAPRSRNRTARRRACPGRARRPTTRCAIPQSSTDARATPPLRPRGTPAARQPVAQNAEIVRKVFAAFSRRDLDALLAFCDPEIVFVPPTGRLAGRDEPYRGHDGMRTYLADVARVWQELRSEPEEYVEIDDDRVLCTGRVYAWGIGRVIDAPAGWVWRLRDGLVVEGRVYETRRAAYEAVGMAWPPRPPLP